MYGLLSFFRYNSWGPIECGDKKWIKVVGSTKCEDKNDVDQLISLKKITKNSLQICTRKYECLLTFLILGGSTSGHLSSW